MGDYPSTYKEIDMAGKGKGKVLSAPAGNAGKGSGPGKPGGSKIPGDPMRKNLGGS